MPRLGYVDVRLLVDGRPLLELPVPDHEEPDEFSATRYVEISTGQEFAIQVKWLSGFELRQAPALAYKFTIDESDIIYPDHLVSKDLQRCRETLTKDYTQSYPYAAFFNDSTGNFEKFAFKFGALGTSDDLSCHTNLNVDKLSQLGRVKVKLFRAKAEGTYNPVLYAPDSVTILPEKVMKGREIKNNVKYESNGNLAQAPSNYASYVPIAGCNGKPYEINFLYRSRIALQKLGVVERSPSPPPDLNLILARTEDMLNQSKEEIRRLRAENERLRQMGGNGETTPVTGGEDSNRSRTISQASSRFEDRTSTQQASSSAEVPQRRKRRGEENDQDELQELGPPFKKPALVIDLTDE